MREVNHRGRIATLMEILDGERSSGFGSPRGLDSRRFQKPQLEPRRLSQLQCLLDGPDVYISLESIDGSALAGLLLRLHVVRLVVGDDDPPVLWIAIQQIDRPGDEPDRRPIFLPWREEDWQLAGEDVT